MKRSLCLFAIALAAGCHSSSVTWLNAPAWRPQRQSCYAPLTNGILVLKGGEELQGSVKWEPETQVYTVTEQRVIPLEFIEQLLVRQSDGAFAEVIIPGDTLAIEVDRVPSLKGLYPVNHMGAVDLGWVGPVILLHMTPEEAATRIRMILPSRPTLTVQAKVTVAKPGSRLPADATRTVKH